MDNFQRKGIFLLVGVIWSFTVMAQNEVDNLMKQAQKKVARMKKSGFEFTQPDDLNTRMFSLFEKRQELNEKGEKNYFILEVTTKGKDPEIAEDLMQFKLPVELAAVITTYILQMIETELVQSTTYWQLGGHDYFLEVQQAIDEVALATSLTLPPDQTIYKARRQTNKNHEYSVGLIYSRQRMLDLFIFEAGNYEILDSIYWLNREGQEEQQ